ncbi:hypothetical protein Q1695_013029 [Nippostrongylus brasiliensis]|nr:hypothetical protein Q1695_013029 [Nippostrongylus brasiliensis]
MMDRSTAEHTTEDFSSLFNTVTQPLVKEVNQDSTSSGTVSQEPQNRNPLLVRRPVVRAYRFKKETSICGFTCSCCYHTLLKARRRKMGENHSTEAARPSSYKATELQPPLEPNNSSQSSSSQTAEEVIDTVADGQTTSTAVPSAVDLGGEGDGGGEKETVENISGHGTTPTLDNAELFGQPVAVGGLVTRETGGEKVQFAAKKPRRNSSAFLLAKVAESEKDEPVWVVDESNAETLGKTSPEAQVPIPQDEGNSLAPPNDSPVFRPTIKRKRIYHVFRDSPQKLGSDDQRHNNGDASTEDSGTKLLVVKCMGDVTPEADSKEDEPLEPSAKRMKVDDYSKEIGSEQDTATESDAKSETSACVSSQLSRSSESTSIPSTFHLRRRRNSETIGRLGARSFVRSRSTSGRLKLETSMTTGSRSSSRQPVNRSVITRSMTSASCSSNRKSVERPTSARKQLSLHLRTASAPNSPGVFTRSQARCRRISESTVCFQRTLRSRRIRVRTPKCVSSRSIENGKTPKTPKKAVRRLFSSERDAVKDISIRDALLFEESARSANKDVLPCMENCSSPNISKGSPTNQSKTPARSNNTSASRRRKRRFITLRKRKIKGRRTVLGNVFGSPVRKRIDVDQWAQEGEDKYTRQAVQLFAKVQEEHQKLKQLRMSDSGFIEWVNLGGMFEIKAWYSGNYPAEYSRLKMLYVCDGCFSYFGHQVPLMRHMSKCQYRFAPPGNEIYRDKDKNVSVFEVHGTVDQMYCSNLCRLTMLWLENKVIFMDVEPFDFYVVTEFVGGRFRPIGHFSRQRQFLSYNLSCFCVFPCYQGRGFGTFIVDFSSGSPGGPERPFSELGNRVYQKYWCDKLIHFIYTKVREFGWRRLNIDIADVAKGTGIQESEVVEALTGLCNSEWTRNKQSLLVKVTEESLMAIGRYISERNAEKLLAKPEYLDPNFRIALKLHGSEQNRPVVTP